ncbi:MAG TPA: hypothetical protein VGN14_07225 [Candidatus Elarobacter sp.]|jgi:hypothetical protein
MLEHASSPRRDRTAIGLSIAVHCCVLAALAAVPRPAFTPDVVDERTLLASMITIEHRASRPARTARRTLPLPAPAKPVERPVLHVARAESHAARRLVVAQERRFVGRPAEVIQPAKAPQPPVPVAAEPGPQTIAGNATAVPSPTPAPTAAVVVASHDEGIGNFGEDYPAKVDPQARATLFAGISDTVQLRVSVDENGHAIAIEFVRAPSDPSQLQELRARLLAARFIPAVCNGLRCAGTVPLHN